MAKNIAISDELYEILAQLKRKDESFTDVIKRLLPPKSMLSDIAGSKTFTYEEWKKVKTAFQSHNQVDEVKKQELLDKLG